ncbi:acylphosphatase [Acinetobacter wanghuae]|uniref:acylphosphatase n=1 Tax=Acinetobacter wanghuae TaxID=2662362 RepID=UPI003AF47E09
MLGLKGTVKNLVNGNVVATLVGDKEKIAEMIKRSYEGPLHAIVDDIQQLEFAIDECHFQGFKILR